MFAFNGAGPVEARYAWYFLATQRDVTGYRHWLSRSAQGRRLRG